jgi:hypothetical protein
MTKEKMPVTAAIRVLRAPRLPGGDPPGDVARILSTVPVRVAI